MPRMIATEIKPSREILAENLTRILAERGRGAKKQLAEALGVHPTRITELIQATGNPTIATIDAICQVLEVCQSDLFSENC